jgi:hypothetical protein
MRNHIVSAQGMFLHEFGNGRLGTGVWVMEAPYALSLVEEQSPAVAMHIGGSSAKGEAFEAEGEIRWRGAIHAEELALQGEYRCDTDITNFVNIVGIDMARCKRGTFVHFHQKDREAQDGY